MDVDDALVDLRTTSTPKDRQRRHGSKLQLRLADLQQVVAALEKGINVRKDGTYIEIPRLGRAGADGLGCLLIQSLPFLAYE